jgi:hypothetical protein
VTEESVDDGERVGDDELVEKAITFHLSGRVREQGEGFMRSIKIANKKVGKGRRDDARKKRV